MTSIFILIATFITAINALTITSPSAGAILDPTQPITVSWTSTSDDPSSFNLLLDQTNGGLVSDQPIAVSVPTSEGTFYIPANTVLTYGSSFILKATGDQASDVLASSGTFDLSVGSATTIDGTLTNVPTATFTGSAQGEVTGTAQSAIAATVSTDSETATESKTTLSGSRTGFSTSTTSTASRSSGSTTSSTSSASATTSANAQPRLGSQSQIAFSAAGILLGFAALLS